MTKQGKEVIETAKYLYKDTHISKNLKGMLKSATHHDMGGVLMYSGFAGKQIQNKLGKQAYKDFSAGFDHIFSHFLDNNNKAVRSDYKEMLHNINKDVA